MKKQRVQCECNVCSSSFECRPSEVGRIVTCGRECSLKYRSMHATGRPMTWSEKIRASVKASGKQYDTSYITPEYREKRRQQAIASGLGSHWRGKSLTDEHAKKIAAAHVGHTRRGWKLSEEARSAMSERFSGSRSSFWRGGKTAKNAAARSSMKYRDWRKAVFERDNYTCCFCGARGCALNADHIKPFSTHEELRFDVGNGRTLCVSCHRKTDTYGRRTAVVALGQSSEVCN